MPHVSAAIARIPCKLKGRRPHHIKAVRQACRAATCIDLLGGWFGRAGRGERVKVGRGGKVDGSACSAAAHGLHVVT